MSFPLDDFDESQVPKNKQVKIKEKKIMEDGKEVEVEVLHDIGDIEEALASIINIFQVQIIHLI